MNLGDIQELTPQTIGRMHGICAHEAGPLAPWFGAAVQQDRQLSQQCAPLGRRVFGAFRDGRAIGRVELMPIDLAPLPLAGEEVQVIRCLWVLKEAQGCGCARALMERALAAAEGAKGVAIVTYPGWNDIPPAFLAKFGFAPVQREGIATLLLRRTGAGAEVAFVPVPREVTVSPSQVQVEAVISGMCPAAAQYYRMLLETARSLSDRVVTREHLPRNRAEALRVGRENTVYIDGTEPLAGPFRTAAFRALVQERLAAKQ